MKNFGLIGEKLGHSLSAPIHEAYYRLTGTRATYRLMARAPDEVSDLRNLMAREGLSGVNVTIPYKRMVLPLLDEISPEARSIGAVNTVSVREGALVGDNTDAFGFAQMLAHGGVSIAGQTVALLGATGGAARAAIHALLMGGVKQLYLVSRDPLNRAMPGPRCAWVSYQNLNDLSYDVLVNATPAGMYPACEACPVCADAIVRASALVDLIYNPAQTRFLQIGRGAGRKTMNGLYMLVTQAVRSEEIWQRTGAERGLIDAIYREIAEEAR